jgi:quinol monooxygenase YgiN
MAVGVIFDGVGVTQAQYEQARDQVLPGNKVVPGLLSHAAGPSENGWCVTEIWESQEVLEQFFREKLGAALQQANITVQPRMFQVVNKPQA